MFEERMSAHRFRWTVCLVAATAAVLLWQNCKLRADLSLLDERIEKAVEAANKASEYAWQARNQVTFDNDDRQELERLRND